MAVNVVGLVVLIVFYAAILILGLWAGKKASRRAKDGVFLANRNLGMVVATFTLTATMVGGGYINGTAEVVYKRGMVWTQAPIAYTIGMILGGVFFAPKLRRALYTTVFDPFQIKYGNRLGALMFIPQLIGDLFWGAAILRALGASLSIILELDQTISVIVSALVAIVYTFFGGLYSVAYTDIVQMICIAVGLEFFQRSLACKTPFIAGAATVLGGVFSSLQAIPAIAIGIIASATDWNQTTYNGTLPFSDEEKAMVLPLVMHYLCPAGVSVIGLGAVSAAVMSSADSIVLSTGTCVAHNIYKNIFRPKATDRELIWVLRISLVLSGAVTTGVALLVSSVYVLFYLCADFLYLVNFPQLLCVLWIDFVDSYGYLSGTVLAVFLRMAGGEKYLNFPALIHYPGYDSVNETQRFPYKSFSMVCGLVTTLVVSLLTRYLFNNGVVSLKHDFIGYYRRRVKTPDSTLDIPNEGIEDETEKNDDGELVTEETRM